MRLAPTFARSIAALSVAALACVPVAGAAAEPGQGSKQNSNTPVQTANDDQETNVAKQGKGKDKGKDDAEQDDDEGTGKAKGTGTGKGGEDPAGNNGTVKIAPLGELDRIPNNTPHPGCTFQVEWYGFDEGAAVVSTVTFAMHAPTQDVGLAVAGETSVFVGGDPASGAGTETGLDGREAYTLSFEGEPHPQQGYHVKLTVATPRSQGNDTKTKVFWVEPCEDDEGLEGPGDEGADEGDGEDDADEGKEGGAAAGGSGRSSVAGPSEGEDDAEQDGADSAVSGTPSAGSGDAAQVPTAVDAGDGGRSALDWARSPAGLLIVGAGALLAAGAFLLRRRAGLGDDV